MLNQIILSLLFAYFISMIQSFSAEIIIIIANFLILTANIIVIKT